MKVNVGSTDSTIRIIVGMILIGMTAIHAIDIWGWIGVVPLLTGIIKFCPAYAIFGISSCPKDKS
jgi:Protein of unknown function (DUF2892)